jgi:hypothetical protein
MTKAKAYTTENEKKSLAGFLYLFVALARKKSQEESVKELRRLSGLIEAEITELQNCKTGKLRSSKRYS